MLEKHGQEMEMKTLYRGSGCELEVTQEEVLIYRDIH